MLKDSQIMYGEQYRHISTGRVVTVIDRVGYCWGVVGVYKSDKQCPVFASELELFATKANGHQTVKGSFVESIANIFVGFSINFTANMLILPMFGFTGLTMGKNFVIGLLYTVISLVRSFVIRRYFNGLKWCNK